jgi:PKD repeat protein
MRSHTVAAGARLACVRLARPRRRRDLGQSLAEFALILPVLLLLTLVAIDFGRVYLGWVNLQNMSRIAANYAANHPTAWATNNAASMANYQAQIRADAKANNCTLPLVSGVQTAPDPTFTPDTNIGSTAEVLLSCSFQILTPIIGNIVGSGGNVTVSASSTFPIKHGQFAIAGGTPSAPVADFTGTPTTITDGSSVVFDDTSTGVPDTWLWDFGDGQTSPDENPIHQYNLVDPLVAATYTVALTATNSIGSDTRTKTAYIRVNPAPPTVSFTGVPESGDRPLPVDFTGTSTGTPTSVLWTFGDGQTSTAGLNVTHVYQAAGTYTVTLAVTTATGSSSMTRSNYITVNVGTCTVPSFIDTSTSTAQATWGTGPGGAGFTTNVNFQQGNLPWTIKSQSLTGGSVAPCNSNITVSKN